MSLRVQGNGADRLLQSLFEEAKKRDVYAVVRLQDLRSQEIVAADGTVEATRAIFSRGFGLHLFDAEGHATFAAGDGWDASEALRTFEQACRSLDSARAAGADVNRAIFDTAPVQDVVDPPTSYRLGQIPLRELTRSLLDIHGTVRDFQPNLRARSFYSATRDEWRIARSDGTDVAFCVPRSMLAHSLTLGEGKGRSSSSSSIFGTSHELLLEDRESRRSLHKSQRNAETLARMVVADPFPGGSFPIVMDHSLSKVLAHEAFGHAAEADGLRSSVLAKNGKFRAGELVASPGVQLIDESIPGDHAFQPYSSNGVKRERATIIRNGVLEMGLADVFSAAEGGVPVTGAGRAESYRHIPLPRMSNIRIELEDAAPLDLDIAEELTPELAREVLIREGFLSPSQPKVIFLSEFRGGQVNPARGDFVFNCQSQFELSLDGVKDWKPGIFSGSVMGALKAIRGGVGELRLDALGFCGKSGQRVPSSGGSHRLLFLEANENIRLGRGG